jgi:thiol-disulfide isomerase/thioredoxin
MKLPSGKSVGIFLAGCATGVLAVIAGLVAMYFIFSKPMLDKAREDIAHKAPPLPNTLAPIPAVLEGRWTSLGGQPLEVSSLKGKVTVLNVWATWCSPCLAELPSLDALHKHYAAAPDVAVVCVSTEALKLAQDKMRALGMKDLLYSTDGAKLPSLYRKGSIPATFIIDKQGRVVFSHVGLADWSAPETIAYIDSLR